jgi:hypothetical protein
MVSWTKCYIIWAICELETRLGLQMSRIWGCDCRRDMDWILNLLTPLVTTNYIATANLHNSQFTTAHAKPFPAYCIFTCRPLATASNSGDSSAFRAQVLPSSSLVQNCPPATPSTGLGSSLYSLAPDPTENTVYNYSSIVACIYVVAGTCVPNRCLAIDVSSGSTIPNFRHHVTIFFCLFPE